MQAQTTRTFGRNPVISTAIGIGILAAGLLGVATFSDSIDLLSPGSGSATIEPPAETSGAAPSYNFREVNLCHPGFETRQASGSARDTADMRLAAVIPVAESGWTVQPALEAASIDINTVLHPGSDNPVEVTPNQPS